LRASLSIVPLAVGSQELGPEPKEEQLREFAKRREPSAHLPTLLNRLSPGPAHRAFAAANLRRVHPFLIVRTKDKPDKAARKAAQFPGHCDERTN
jgi:hypothetical protein